MMGFQKRLGVAFLVLWMGCLLTPTANAALNLELTQGINAALPIAILPFKNEQQAMVPGNETITQVIRNDLQNSGQFRIESPGWFAKASSDVSQLDFNYWRKHGVNDVLVGTVNSIGAGRYQVSFQLIGLYNTLDEKDAASKTNSVLVTQSYTVGAAGLRRLAHQISNIVFQKLTGIRGIFNTKIAYILVQRLPSETPKYTLEVADADGFNPEPLLVSSQPIMSPSWSPKGKKIVYVSFEGNHAAIYIQDIATGQRQLISQFPGINGAPAFSPDGTKLAMVLTRTGSPKIYVMNLQTRQLTQITHGYSIDTEPAWAPDGKTLLFTSNRGGSPQIYQYDFASQQVQRLSFSGDYNARASYLPDEQGMVMMHRETGMFGIATQNFNTGNVQVLVQTGNDESPSISPNGKMVIYATEYGDRGVLAVVSTDGRIKLRLPAREGSVQEPVWSPFMG